MVQDKRKTKAQLIVELEELRARVARLEKKSRPGDGGDPTPSETADRKTAEDALLSERNRAQQYLDIAGVMFVVLDAKGCVTLINRKGLEILGYGREEDLLGKNWFDACIPTEVKEGVKAVFGEIMAGRLEPVEYYDNPVRTRSGDTRVIAWHNAVLTSPDGERIGTLSSGQDITDRKLGEEALRESEETFELFMNHIPGIVFIKDAESRPLFINKGMKEALGASDEWLGQSIEALFPGEQGKAMRADDQEALERGYLEREELLPCNDGSTRTYRTEKFAILRPGAPPLVGGVAFDITERKCAEEQLRLTQYSIDRMKDAVYWMGPDAHFIYVNDAACRALGYEREELLNMTVHDIDPEFPAEVWPTHWADVKERKTFLIETTHRAKGGRTFPVEISLNYLEFEGRELNIAIARDISERRQAEEEKRQLEEQMRNAQKLESLGVLAGGIAHDFNNLLVGIMGNADLALMDVLPTEAGRENIEAILTSSHRAADLCKQMLAYSGRGRFVVEVVDLSTIVEEMAHLLAVSLSKRVTLRYDFAPDTPAIKADVTQLRQVILNLITNASDAVGDTTGAISVATSPIQCDSAYLKETYLAEDLPEGVYACLEVKDSGCGMDEDTQAKVFDPFFSTKAVGRGLGLAAVLGIVRGHEGALKVESEVGKGTTFTILFPGTNEPPESTNSIEAADETWRGQGTVLVVDDEEPVRAVARHVLERVGFEVITAPDGRAGLEMYEKNREEIVAVLLDMTMPRMSGEETLDELRGLNKEVKVILSSGYNEMDAITRFQGQGLSGFIQKPFRSQQLLDVLKAVLGH